MAEAAIAVVHHDFGPRLLLPGVEQRVRALVLAATKVLAWVLATPGIEAAEMADERCGGGGDAATVGGVT